MPLIVNDILWEGGIRILSNGQKLGSLWIIGEKANVIGIRSSQISENRIIGYFILFLLSIPINKGESQ
jgi:hypothetical protein